MANYCTASLFYRAKAASFNVSVALIRILVGPSSEVRLPTRVSTQIDYEAELAVVISKQGRDIPAAEALDHVFGYTIVNDVTARDVQMRHQQWDLGKSFDTFCPMGPWVVTADALNGADTRVRCWVIHQEKITRR
jgi:2-keto-4-pentenoate hydratase/2-oxohepta-3-ene-1,7-dioic acid hydratase in catechol pathway